MQIVAVLLVSGFIASALAADGRLGPKANCVCDGMACECCGGFRFRKNPRTACVRTNYNINELTMDVEFTMDGTVVARRSIGPNFVPFCAPAPPLTVCMNARKVFLSKDQAKLCASMDVKMLTSSIFKARLPCLTMAGGQFSVTRD